MELARDPPALLRDGTVCRGDRVLLRLMDPLHPRDASATVAAVEVQRVDDGLWHWTAPHPEWKPGDDWERDVGCVYWEAGDAVVLVDPLVPDGRGGPRRGSSRRSTATSSASARPSRSSSRASGTRAAAHELAERYDARVVAPPAAERLPGGATALDAPAAEEVVYWLPGARALVPGDTLLGTHDGVALPGVLARDRGRLDELAPELRAAPRRSRSSGCSRRTGRPYSRTAAPRSRERSQRA